MVINVDYLVKLFAGIHLLIKTKIPIKGGHLEGSVFDQSVCSSASPRFYPGNLCTLLYKALANAFISIPITH